MPGNKQICSILASFYSIGLREIAKGGNIMLKVPSGRNTGHRHVNFLLWGGLGSSECLRELAEGVMTRVEGSLVT